MEVEDITFVIISTFFVVDETSTTGNQVGLSTCYYPLAFQDVEKVSPLSPVCGRLGAAAAR